MGALGIVIQLIGMLPQAVQATSQVVGIISKVKGLMASGTEPTDADWDSLNKELATLKAQLDLDPSATA